MYVIESIRNVLYLSYYSLLDLVPYVIVGIIIGELLKLTSWTKILINVKNSNVIFSCFIACLLGIASPLCTLGTVPVAISLFTAGFPLAPLVGFIACSSMLNPQFMIYTYGELGVEMTIARFFSVLIFGMIVSLIVTKLNNSKVIKKQLSSEEITANSDCIQNKAKQLPTFKQFLINCLKQAEYIFFYMILGILIGTIFETVLPKQNIYHFFSEENWYSVILASVMGVPLYQCGGGAIPVIGSLINSGMGTGHALAFFLVGPATNVNSIVAFATIFKPKYVILYIVLVLLFALFLGYSYPYIISLFELIF